MATQRQTNQILVRVTDSELHRVQRRRCQHALCQQSPWRYARQYESRQEAGLTIPDERDARPEGAEYREQHGVDRRRVLSRGSTERDRPDQQERYECVEREEASSAGRHGPLERPDEPDH